VETAKAAAYAGVDFVKEVTSKETHAWDSNNQLSREWVLRRGSEDPRESDEKGNVFEQLPPVTHTLAALDFGMKKNILRSLRRQGFDVTVLPATTSADEILALGTDGVFLSNGPGDPEALDYASETARQLIGKKPIFGICLGNQLLAHAYGGTTFKLKFGHRGGNQPVKDLRTGQISITSQNHGFAVDPDSLPPEIEVTHINLNDQTVEGMRHKTHPVFSVQYHPEAAPGPNDASYLFEEFSRLIEESK
jgi:carbamoyl-phosphate synthase small subunit